MQIAQDSDRSTLCNMEERRGVGIFQGTSCSDLEDRFKLSITFDDKGENYRNHLGPNTCIAKVAIVDAR